MQTNSGADHWQAAWEQPAGKAGLGDDRFQCPFTICCETSPLKPREAYRSCRYLRQNSEYFRSVKV